MRPTALLAGASAALLVLALGAKGVEGATAAPTVGPERPVAGQRLVPDRGAQADPAVASDGTNHLVVWAHRPFDVDRFYPRVERGLYPPTEIVATRVSAAGAVLDPGTITVATLPSTQDPSGMAPAVAWNGSSYLVTWGVGSTIRAARVSSAGTVLDATPIQIAAGSAETPARVASDGSGFLVAWKQFGAGTSASAVKVARVSGAGTLVDTTPLTVSTGANLSPPGVAWNGARYLVVWRDIPSDSRLVARRVSATGAVLDSNDLLITSADSDGGQVAASGGDFVVAWAQGGDIRAARVSTTGVVRDPGGFVVSNAIGTQSTPSLGSNGATVLVAWADTRSGSDIYGSRITGSTVNDPAGVRLFGGSPDSRAPAVTTLGSAFLVVSNGVKGRNTDVYGTRVSGAGSVLDPAGRVLSPVRATPHFETAVDHDPGGGGATSLVAWTQPSSAGTPEVRAARLDGRGVSLDPAGILLGTGQHPALAWNGSAFLVAWATLSGGGGVVRAALVSPAGLVLDPGVIVLGAGDHPAVAAGGSSFLVAWSDPGDYEAGFFGPMYARRIGGDGRLPDPSPVPLPGYGSRADVAWSGTLFLVVWEQLEGGGEDFVSLEGARVSAAGAVLDPDGAFRFAGGGRPAVAWTGGTFLVVAHAAVAGPSNVAGFRVSEAGTAGPPVGIATTSTDERFPDVAAQAGGFLVIWQDRRSATSGLLRAARVSSGGIVQDQPALTLESRLTGESTIGLSSGTGEALAYDRLAPGAPYGGSSRAFFRAVSK